MRGMSKIVFGFILGLSTVAALAQNNMQEETIANQLIVSYLSSQSNDEDNTLDPATRKKLEQYAKEGNQAAIRWLFDFYEQGLIETEEGSDELLLWTKTAAEIGVPRAQYDLASLYNRESTELYNPTLAFYWMQIAANNQFTYAFNDLGIMYEYGTGTAQNTEKALEMYTLASNHGDTGAMHNLGLIYSQGKLVDQNPQKAINWFTMAAISGEACSDFTIGEMFQHGIHENLDLKKAQYWYSKAVSDAIANQNRWSIFHDIDFEEADIDVSTLAEHFASFKTQAKKKKKLNYIYEKMNENFAEVCGSIIAQD